MEKLIVYHYVNMDNRTLFPSQDAALEYMKEAPAPLVRAIPMRAMNMVIQGYTRNKHFEESALILVFHNLTKEKQDGDALLD